MAETLEEMAADEDSRNLAQQLQARGQAALTREERRARQRSLESLSAPSFPSLLQVSRHPGTFFWILSFCPGCLPFCAELWFRLNKTLFPRLTQLQMGSSKLLRSPCARWEQRLAVGLWTSGMGRSALPRDK